MSVSSASEPNIPDDVSMGSSVSSRLQDEYEELLKYAVVLPKFDAMGLPKVLTDKKHSFPLMPDQEEQLERLQEMMEEVHSDSNRSSPVSMPLREPSNLSARSDRRRIGADTTLTSETIHQAIGASPRLRGMSPSRFDYPVLATPTTEPYGGRLSPSYASEGQEEEGDAMRRDLDLGSMEAKLDLWCRHLKSNILEEVARMRIKSTEQARMKLSETETKHINELNALHGELESMKELLSTYEVTLERKDGVVANLTRSLQNQKERFEVLRNFASWKINYFGHKQEGYGMKIAMRHHELVLKRKCWVAWYSIIMDRWRRRVEKACQAKAQEVCISLTNDYESKLESVNEALEAARVEVERLHRERESYEENMKKAFMRGVCALNVEAMNIFNEDGDQVGVLTSSSWASIASTSNIQQLQTIQNKALRTITGCTWPTDISLLHTETKILPVFHHLNMRGMQFFSLSTDRHHPCFQLHSNTKPPRHKKLDPLSHYSGSISSLPAPPPKTTLNKHLHTSFTKLALESYKPSKILAETPPPIHNTELSLPRASRVDLFRLRSGLYIPDYRHTNTLQTTHEHQHVPNALCHHKQQNNYSYNALPHAMQQCSDCRKRDTERGSSVCTSPPDSELGGHRSRRGQTGHFDQSQVGRRPGSAASGRQAHSSATGPSGEPVVTRRFNGKKLTTRITAAGPVSSGSLPAPAGGATAAVVVERHSAPQEVDPPGVSGPYRQVQFTPNLTNGRPRQVHHSSMNGGTMKIVE